MNEISEDHVKVFEGRDAYLTEVGARHKLLYVDKVAIAAASNELLPAQGLVNMPEEKIKQIEDDGMIMPLLVLQGQLWSGYDSHEETLTMTGEEGIHVAMGDMFTRMSILSHVLLSMTTESSASMLMEIITSVVMSEGNANAPVALAAMANDTLFREGMGTMKKLSDDEPMVPSPEAMQAVFERPARGEEEK